MQADLDYNSFIVPRRVPQDINAETFVGLYPDNSIAVKFCGMHKRNSYKDILDIENYQDKLLLHMGRNSLYNSLPEYLFHSIDRFSNIPEREKQKFEEEYSKQEHEKEQAYKFFYPIDTFLFLLRMQVRKQLGKYVDSNVWLQQIVFDRLTEGQKNNRFIAKTIPYMPSFNIIRGNRTLMTLLLRKVFLDEGILVNISAKDTDFTDICPRYSESVGDVLGEVYAGNCYSQSVVTYEVHYWDDEQCDSRFLSFVDELDEYRLFVQDYLLSADVILKFDITVDSEPLILSDTEKYNYLNYNTNI